MTENDREQGVRQRDNQDGAEGLGGSSDSSEINRDESHQNANRSGTGDASSSQGFTREDIIGGILRQLRSLQEAHLAYVNAHGDRLEARLAENRQHKQTILQDMEDLEGEVNKLLTLEENPPATNDEEE
jgi:hypothetical protein